MSDSLIVDDALRASQTALDGLSLKQQAISRNIANVDTPGYQAQTVDFKQVISQAMSANHGVSLVSTNPMHLASNSPASTMATVARPGGTERADQNDVNIDTELTDMSQTTIYYQAISQEISQKLLLLKAIASGG